ncbi:NAD-dependent protein deacylase sirtuin-5, mitochondrial [Clonorchis sinensis]|uniref:NAD-dependent protein deacylase n=1 Tax=Clonorchis sinensis TaxID=79923 RepID=A0A8T1ML30_CLOSI|nr:NAD-dependent protein deacylase sirtuin-5, mitochondrial [Clonorchis sinensis]
MFVVYQRSLLRIMKNVFNGSNRPSSNLCSFRDVLSKARNVLVITGAGMSAESGVPTFRGAGGLWRNYNAQDLATPYAFYDDPGLVWEFYHYRRELVRKTRPNPGHLALADAEKRFNADRRSFTVVTQNVDGLHGQAGSVNVLELHGNLFKTRCTKCSDVRVNLDSPICPALENRGSPVFDPQLHGHIPEEQLPRCHKPISDKHPDRLCNGLLRPHVVWFGESLDTDVLRRVGIAMTSADACLVVGTSAVVYPAAGFAQELAARGVPVAEVNVEVTPATKSLGYFFQGKSGEILPELFNDLSLS